MEFAKFKTLKKIIATIKSFSFLLTFNTQYTEMFTNHYVIITSNYTHQDPKNRREKKKTKP